MLTRNAAVIRNVTITCYNRTACNVILKSKDWKIPQLLQRTKIPHFSQSCSGEGGHSWKCFWKNHLRRNWNWFCLGGNDPRWHYEIMNYYRQRLMHLISSWVILKPDIRGLKLDCIEVYEQKSSKMHLKWGYFLICDYRRFFSKIVLYHFCALWFLILIQQSGKTNELSQRYLKTDRHTHTNT